jgi:hypothetical protein
MIEVDHMRSEFGVLLDQRAAARGPRLVRRIPPEEAAPDTIRP